MSFSIEQTSSIRREALSQYEYRAYKDARFVATYWHDHRGGEHGLVFLNGTTESWPVGRMTDFIEGGGPNPLVLSAKAIAYLEGRSL